MMLVHSGCTHQWGPSYSEQPPDYWNFVALALFWPDLILCLKPGRSLGGWLMDRCPGVLGLGLNLPGHCPDDLPMGRCFDALPPVQNLLGLNLPGHCPGDLPMGRYLGVQVPNRKR